MQRWEEWVGWLLPDVWTSVCMCAVSVPLKRVRQEEEHDTRSEKHCLSLEKFWLFYGAEGVIKPPV